MALDIAAPLHSAWGALKGIIMSDPEPLVTVATFDSLPQAELARSLLDEEGIRSFLADAETVNMAWYISGAVGGVKLQVAKSDFLKAERILNSKRGRATSSSLDDYGLDNSTAVTNDPDAVRQEHWETEEPSDETSLTADPGSVRDEQTASAADDVIEKDNDAEIKVRAALRAALLGLIACPPFLHIYSLWLLMTARESGQPLRGSYRNMFTVAAAVDAVILALTFILVVYVCAGNFLVARG
jgi:hypothetical protein